MASGAQSAAPSNVALYRRYRPDTFADVIGQEHVTDPLRVALRKNRVHHAYLFSGPRGCGKTTSARILARCLNCAEGPTDVPCGVCDSCVELSRDGSGSLDVIEIDAASHGGVDDARDLRERATFAPVRDRYKIFVIDEAHMVTSAGFNALLKIVEEPPEHIKFVFATTEPDKVIGTIRSRTHHYPFRLVPPEPLLGYLERLCQSESVPVAPGVLSLVVRAGGGSVRDSLSVLDQLMAGAADQGLDYEMAVALLGYTHASLLDDVVDAISAADAATVFRAVDRVIQTGHDPRRFVEDLLERFRDLIIVNAMPDSAHAILRGMPEDQISRMRNQASHLGAAELSRAADITNTALTEMTGATSPRLHLELLCARILLPGAEEGERGLAARVDRIERRLQYGGTPAAAPPAEPAEQQSAPADAPQSNASAAPAAEPEAPPAPASDPAVSGPAASSPVSSVPEASGPATPTAATSEPAASAQEQSAQEQSAPPARPEAPARPAPLEEPEQAAEPHGPDSDDGTPPAGSGPASDWANTSTAAPSDPAPEAAAASPARAADSTNGGAGSVEMIRRAWPEIMDTLSGIRKVSWMMVKDYAAVKSFDGTTVELSFDSPGRAAGFNRQDHLDNMSQAINQVLGVKCAIRPVHDDPSAGEPDPKASSRPTPAASAGESWAAPQSAPDPQDDGAASGADRNGNGAAPASGWSTNGSAPTSDWDDDQDEEGQADWGPEPVPDDSWDASNIPTSDTADDVSWPEPVATGSPGDSPAQPQDQPPERRLSRYEEMSRSAAAQPPDEPEETSRGVELDTIEDIPSADDETIEESGLVGRAAVERILGGRLIEERNVDGSG
nr:DNA polymerase III subunit gamma and tau [Arthrobacter castelli]